MKAIVVHNPFAELFFLPPDDPRVKLVENRTWKTAYRGPLYILAGKSRGMLVLDPLEKMDANWEVPIASMRFGWVIGTVVLRHCCSIEDIRDGKYDRAFPWLRRHQHAHGPWCWIFELPNRIQPFEYKGAQGLFNIPESARPPAGAPIALPF